VALHNVFVVLKYFSWQLLGGSAEIYMALMTHLCHVDKVVPWQRLQALAVLLRGSARLCAYSWSSYSSVISLKEKPHLRRDLPAKMWLRHSTNT